MSWLEAIVLGLIQGLTEFLPVSSSGHLEIAKALFGVDPELAMHPELLARKGCQFHWENPGYRDFTDFLDTLTAKRRKEIKRERRQTVDAGITVERIHGHQADEATWQAARHAFVCDPLEPVKLKGKQQSVQPYLVRGRLARAAERAPGAPSGVD